MNPADLFHLEAHGSDVFVGVGPRYPWGGLFGGQIVAQALKAAADTVEPGTMAHSLRAYFIRRGDADEPIRFEVDRIRNGRSFTTRRVVARQAVGAILNLEASFQAEEDTEDIQSVQLDPSIPGPDELPSDSWSEAFDRRRVDPSLLPASPGHGRGRIVHWMRTKHPLPDDQLLHRCWLAYMSDEVPIDSIHASHPTLHDREHEPTMSASLDHSMWFHRPLRADEWHLYDVSCVSYQHARGLTIGNVFSLDGRHVATFAQEGLVRRAR